MPDSRSAQAEPRRRGRGRRIAFVTGASRGIGRASALALADAGYDVVVTARTLREGERYEYSPTLAGAGDLRALPGSLEATARDVEERGQRALPLRLDLLERESIDTAIDETLHSWGSIDLLLNNGIFQGPGLMDRFLEVPEDACRRIFEGNVFAQIHLTQRIVGAMARRGQGIVINMTSGAAQMDPPGPAGEGGWGYAYAASKAAFHRMVGVLHVELHAAGVRCYNLDPGYVVTAATRALLEDAADLDQRYRGVPPELPAAVVGWLARDSPDARALCGQTLQATSVCRRYGLLSDLEMLAGKEPPPKEPHP